MKDDEFQMSIDQFTRMRHRIIELESAVNDVLDGEPIDNLNRDDNGLLYYPDLNYIKNRLLGVRNP